MHRPRTFSAFTLIELVLVMIVMTLLLSLAAPALSGWSRGSRLRDVTDDFLAAAAFARSEAIATATVHRLQLDSLSGIYEVTRGDGEQQTWPSGEYAKPKVLPKGFRIELVRSADESVEAITFHPTGRMTPVQVRVIAPWGETVELQCAAPAEQLKRVTPEVR